MTLQIFRQRSLHIQTIKYLALNALFFLICNSCYAAETYMVFTGKSESARINKIRLEHTNACGLIYTRYTDTREILGKLEPSIETYTYLGKWCRGSVSLPYPDQLIVAKKTQHGWQELYRTHVRSDTNNNLYITPFFAAIDLGCEITRYTKILDEPINFTSGIERYTRKNLASMVKEGFLVKNSGLYYATKGISLNWLKDNFNNIGCI